MNTYTNPLLTRYASSEMSSIFSDIFRFKIWRKIWTELARAEKELGLPNIQENQISALEAKIEITEEDLKCAQEREQLVRHDVMAQVYAFAQAVPESAGIIHLGATSCDITDNADLIIFRDGLNLILDRLLLTIQYLANFAKQYADLPCVGYTHFQAAQPTTVGKRATLWLLNFTEDYHRLKSLLTDLPFRGIKGATGTQASFFALFNGDFEKVQLLEQKIAAAFGFTKIVPVTGQTYPRKLDSKIIETLANIGISAAKFANDLRLLAHEQELEEPFEAQQIGSSAMPFKRNPMRCERITSLARTLTNLVSVGYNIAQEQWLERTLDDSAARRIILPEAFLLTDAILILMCNVTQNIVVNETIIQKNLQKQLPFLASELILMEATKQGGNRQELHEKLRQYTQLAAQQIKTGKENSLIELLQVDPIFSLIDFSLLLNPKNSFYIGCAPQQVQQFLEEYINPILNQKINSLENIVFV